MKKDISAIELHYLLKELKQLEDSRLNDIYQTENAVFFMFHKPSYGKLILKATKSFVYLARSKESLESPKGFCQLLRKHIENSRLRKIDQIASERIMELIIETKDEAYKLYIELFGQGNLVLCNKEGAILGFLNQDRDFERLKQYSFPNLRPNLFLMDFDSFKQTMKQAKQETIVKKLASDLGFGGTYAEELCFLSRVDKKSHVVDDESLQRLFSNFPKVLNQELKPIGILKEGQLIDVFPFLLHNHKEFMQFKSFSEALDTLLSTPVFKETKTSKEIKKYEAIINAQASSLEKINKDIELNTKIGNKLYEKFTEVDAILNQAREAKKKIGLKAMKEKIKDSTIIKDVKEDGKIVIWLE